MQWLLRMCDHSYSGLNLSLLFSSFAPSCARLLYTRQKLQKYKTLVCIKYYIALSDWSKGQNLQQIPLFRNPQFMLSWSRELPLGPAVCGCACVCECVRACVSLQLSKENSNTNCKVQEIQTSAPHSRLPPLSLSSLSNTERSWSVDSSSTLITPHC